MRAIAAITIAAALCACDQAQPPARHFAEGPSVGPGVGSIDAGAVAIEAGTAVGSADAAVPSSAMAYVYATRAACASAAASVDLAHGYPRAGVDVGGGIHVPPDQSVTTTYAACTPSADSGAYAYPSDTVTAAALRDAAPRASSIVILDGGSFSAMVTP